MSVISGQMAKQAEDVDRTNIRITLTQEKVFAALDAWKTETTTRFDNLNTKIAERGRVTMPVVASILSMVAILITAGGSYVSMRSEPLERSVISNAAKIATAEVQRLNMEDRLHQLNVKSDVTDAVGETDRKWIMKIQDEMRVKIEKLENK